MSIRSAASCCQLLQEIALPRGARIGPCVNGSCIAMSDMMIFREEVLLENLPQLLRTSHEIILVRKGTTASGGAEIADWKLGVAIGRFRGVVARCSLQGASHERHGAGIC